MRCRYKKINEDITDNKFDTDIDSLLNYEEIKESADVSILKNLVTEITSKAVTTKKDYHHIDMKGGN